MLLIRLVDKTYKFEWFYWIFLSTVPTNIFLLLKTFAQAIAVNCVCSVLNAEELVPVALGVSRANKFSNKYKLWDKQIAKKKIKQNPRFMIEYENIDQVEDGAYYLRTWCSKQMMTDYKLL